MWVATIADSFYIGVLDLAATTAWYTEKLGLRKVPLKVGEATGCIALGFSNNDQVCITLRASRTLGWDDAHVVRFKG